MASIPERGDVVWIDFDPQAGHEQSGRRPALVLSESFYNRQSGLAVFCPITNQVKGYPFEVLIPAGSSVTGVVLVDQVKSFDWPARRVVYHCDMPDVTVNEVRDRIRKLI